MRRKLVSLLLLSGALLLTRVSAHAQYQMQVYGLFWGPPNTCQVGTGTGAATFNIPLGTLAPRQQ